MHWTIILILLVSWGFGLEFFKADLGHLVNIFLAAAVIVNIMLLIKRRRG